MVCIPLRKEKEETKNDTVSSAAKNLSDVISVFYSVGV